MVSLCRHGRFATGGLVDRIVVMGSRYRTDCVTFRLSMSLFEKTKMKKSLYKIKKRT
jgi:hypothetical protein